MRRLSHVLIHGSPIGLQTQPTLMYNAALSQHALQPKKQMLAQSIIIGLLVAFFGYLFQQRAWNHNKREEIRQKEFDESTKIVKDLSRAIERRLFAISYFKQKVDSGDITEQDVEQFKKSIMDWMHEFSSYKSSIYQFFGNEKMIDFEYKIHGSLQKLSAIVWRTHNIGKKKLNKRDIEEHKNIISEQAIARATASNFLNELNLMIKTEKIGRTALYDNLQNGKLDHISRIYLIQRLFGLKL